MPIVICSFCDAELIQVHSQAEARVAFKNVKEHEKKYHAGVRNDRL
jgi:hypothetical protein